MMRSNYLCSWAPCELASMGQPFSSWAEKSMFRGDCTVLLLWNSFAATAADAIESIFLSKQFKRIDVEVVSNVIGVPLGPTRVECGVPTPSKNYAAATGDETDSFCLAWNFRKIGVKVVSNVFVLPRRAWREKDVECLQVTCFALHSNWSWIY